jgi:hypothetical protein
MHFTPTRYSVVDAKQLSRSISTYRSASFAISSVWAMSKAAHSEAYGLAFNEQQRMTITRIWQALDKNTGDYVESEQGGESEEETEEESESETAATQDGSSRLASEVDHNISRIKDRLFALNCQLVAQISRPCEEASLPFVHFVSILPYWEYIHIILYTKQHMHLHQKSLG